MKKNGFTTVELLIVIGIFTVIYAIGVINVTHAFEENPNQNEYNQVINLIEVQAQSYAQNNPEIFGESDVIYIYVSDLIEKSYIVPDENGNIKNPLEGSGTLNELKLKIEKKDNNYSASVVEI